MVDSANRPRPNRPDAPAVVAEHLSFRPAGTEGPYPIHDLSFQLAPGKTLLVSGPTGTGKSILLALIAGLGAFYPTPRVGGRLAVVYPDLAPGTDPLPGPRPGHVGLLHQEPGDGLLGFDVRSALALPLEEAGLEPERTRRRVRDALAASDLLHLEDREVGSLSGGERKRVALAGVEALDPPLVLLDEPLADLDPMGVRRVLEDLHRLRARRTVIIAEHRTELVRPLVDQTLHLLAPGGPAAAPAPIAPEPSPGVSPPAGPPRVTVRNLSVRRGGHQIIDGARFVLGPGIWGLLGPNGAGKTTLLSTLAGLVAPESGDVTVDGVPVWSRGRRPRRAHRLEGTLRQRLQVTFQDPREAFFSATVCDEVSAAPRALRVWRAEDAPDRATRMLRRARRAHLADRAPPRTSGGEARIIQALGALAVGPRVLFLDEPTHGLDRPARDWLAATLGAWADAGSIVVVATHEPAAFPAATGFLFVDGSGSVVTGDGARPGAAGPRGHGYVAEGVP